MVITIYYYYSNEILTPMLSAYFSQKILKEKFQEHGRIGPPVYIYDNCQKAEASKILFVICISTKHNTRRIFMQ